MEIKLKNNLIFHRFILIIISLHFLIATDINNDFNYFIDKYYSQNKDDIINIELDKYVSGNITEDNFDYYNIFLNESEQIFFDFQSEFGCLYIYINETSTFNSSKADFTFCSEGFDTIFSLYKNDILEKINKKEEDKKLDNNNIIVGVGHSSSENNNIEFIYSLKVSLRKQKINIFEINSEHKILCKTEKINGNKYKCLFVITYNIDNNDNLQNENLIIYPSSKRRDIKLNIYSDFINRQYYDKWDSKYLFKNIPNNNSTYTNYNSEKEFIYIPISISNNYIYICVESEKETTIEMYTHIFNKNDEIEIPNINEEKIYCFNQKSINLNFNLSEIDDISISLITINGKASIYFENYDNKKYITDIRENKLLLNMNLNKCLNNHYNNCNLIIDNLEYNEKGNETESDLGYIFYIKYTQKKNIILDEFMFEKSSKLSYDNIKFPIMIYSYIPNITSPININLLFYNLSNLNTNNINYNNNINIDIMLCTSKDIYKIKNDYSNIKKYNTIKGKVNYALLASNIHLSVEDMKKFNISLDDIYIFIYISNNDSDFIVQQLILGVTISQMNSLIYPSERVYHFGELNNEKKIVYRLAGDPKFHLMRLEIGINSNYIKWSVKRTNDNNSSDYMLNDTDLSFVTEKWNNGKGLITMYIERGEDIYLTLFKTDKSSNLTNYAFKYINAQKNGNFKNYINKKDSLSYSQNNKLISINKLNNLPISSIVNYNLKIIEEENYFENEIINTIAMTQSNSSSNIKGINSDNQIIFNINCEMNISKEYHLNAYAQIIGDDLDIEYISYNGLLINKIIINDDESGIDLDTTEIVIIVLSIILISFIIISIICCIIQKRRTERLREEINRIAFTNDSLIEDDLYDDDLLI